MTLAGTFEEREMSTSVLADFPPTRAQFAGSWPDDFLFTIPASAHTLNGFRAWVPSLPDKARVMFYAGEVFLDMSNEDVFFHTSVKGEIFAVLHRLVKETSFGQIFQDGSLLTNEAANVSNNPDAVAVSWRSIEEGRFRVVVKEDAYPEMEGSPDWVLEVVSPSSVTKDKKTLRTAYHAAGIREYWIVDARGAELEFSILTSTDAGYVAAANVDGWQTSPVFGRAFKFTRTIDPRGYFEYSLQMR
jgi:Uma2 family endonuclease